MSAPASSTVGAGCRVHMREDPRKFLIDNLAEIYEFWVPLVCATTLPPDILHTDERILQAFRVLHDAMTRAENRPLLERLTSVRLDTMLTSFAKTIGQNRRGGHVAGKIGQGDVTLAQKAFMAAIGLDPDSATSTKLVQRHVRKAKRWACLSGPTRLLVILYSDTAEGAM